MKPAIKILLLTVCGLIFAGTPLQAQDKMVAIVNNEVITQKDLTDFLNFLRLQYSRQLSGKELEEKVEAVKKDMLQRLIEDRLILQQAKKEKVTIEASRIKAKVDDIKKNYPSEAEFTAELAKQGLVQADLENKISEQMLMYAFLEHKIRNKVVIKPDEATSFYASHKEELVKPEERKFSLFILSDEDQARAMSRQLGQGAKPEDLAAKYSFTSDKFSALKGQELRKEIESTVFKLKAEEVSDPVKVDNQYFIFRLDQINPPQQLTLAQAQDRIKGFLFEKKMQEELEKWLDELKKESYIKILD